MDIRHRSTTVTFRMISTIFTNTKRTINISLTRVHIKITATTSLRLTLKRTGTRCSVTNCKTTPPETCATLRRLDSTTRASFGTSIRAFPRAASIAALVDPLLPPQITRKRSWPRIITTRFRKCWSQSERRFTFGPETVTTRSTRMKLPKITTFTRRTHHSQITSDHAPKAWTWPCPNAFSTTANPLTRSTIGF